MRDSFLRRHYLKKSFKWLFYFLLLIAITLVVAYATTPYWVPSQLQKFLPAELNLKAIDLERPGLTSAKVNELNLEINGTNKANVLLKNVTLNYSILNQKITTIEAEVADIQIQQKTNNNSEDFSSRITLPDLPLDRIELQNLTVSGLFIQAFIFKNLSINNTKDKLIANGQAHFLDLTFDLALELTRSNQLLSKIQSTVKNNDDFISVELIPNTNNQQSMGWSLNSELDINNYFPFETLSDIKVDASGHFSKADLINLHIDQGLQIAAPINTNPLDLKAIVDDLAQSKGLTFDESSLFEPLQFSITTNQALALSFNPLDYQLLLEKGELAVSVEHPITTTRLVLNKLTLNPNSELSAPEQLIGGRLTSALELNNLILAQQNTRIKSGQTSVSFAAPFTIQNSTLELVTHDLNFIASNSTLNHPAISSELPATQWTGTAAIKQNLIGNDESNALDIKLSQSKPITVSLKTNSETIKVSRLFNSIELDKDILKVKSSSPKVDLSQQNLILNNFKAHSLLNLKTNKPSGSISFNNANYSNEQIEITPFNGAVDWSLVKNQLKTKGSIQFQDEKIPFNYSFNINKEQHKLNILPFNITANTISQWLAPQLALYPELTIEQGTISSNAISADPFSLLFDGSANLKNLDISYDKMQLINLSLEETFNTNDQLSGISKGIIERIDIASGIAISELSFQLAHTINNFTFTDIKGNLLDGTVSIPAIEITSESIKPFTVSLESINLGELLESLESESLAIEGNFSFELPIAINQGSQTITDGLFYSVNPGVLQVDSGESATTNIAFQALQNFHYDEFSGTIDYSNKGIYVLDLFLKGSNPDLYDGFPIELKMKVEGNLPNLLYSMLISGDMAKPIIDKYHSGDFDTPSEEP